MITESPSLFFLFLVFLVFLLFLSFNLHDMGKASQLAKERNKQSRVAMMIAVQATLREQVERHLSLEGVNEISAMSLMSICREAIDGLGLRSRAQRVITPESITPKDIMTYRTVYSTKEGKSLILSFFSTVQASVAKNVKERINEVASTICPLPARVCGPNDRPTLRLTERQQAEWRAAGGDERKSLPFTHIVAIVRGVFPTGKHDDMSHLCHNKMCLLHTVWESKEVNAERNNCAAAGTCLRKHPGPECIFPEAGEVLASLPNAASFVA